MPNKKVPEKHKTGIHIVDINLCPRWNFISYMFLFLIASFAVSEDVLFGCLLPNNP